MGAHFEALDELVFMAPSDLRCIFFITQTLPFELCVYYGETGRELRSRFREHKGDIANARQKPVSEHFNLPGHSLRDLIFIGIEKVLPPDDTFLRKQRETFYIRRANSVYDGANRRF